MDFITILNSPNAFEIAIIRNLFDMENIQYKIFDESISSAAGLAGLGINGMRVQVLKADFLRAKRILEKADFN
ncbi:DUF2007 domain-containing protein [Gillisia sp. M10.2A]|uniref:DUF2007 domain-containing protein n=1 Tax=Gillisia lutea TaxID=2909668 RepID=A0ABS9ECD4_9FLAO|nr:DUF2007 domain-containing protein [Gillisia lutea]MCF4100438.1 DUF2007 domain-containing protein [Gillisia lutea]